jgi:hypothetical protein
VVGKTQLSQPKHVLGVCLGGGLAVDLYVGGTRVTKLEAGLPKIGWFVTRPIIGGMAAAVIYTAIDRARGPRTTWSPSKIRSTGGRNHL